KGFPGVSRVTLTRLSCSSLPPVGPAPGFPHAQMPSCSPGPGPFPGGPPAGGPVVRYSHTGSRFWRRDPRSHYVGGTHRSGTAREVLRKAHPQSTSRPAFHAAEPTRPSRRWRDDADQFRGERSDDSGHRDQLGAGVLQSPRQPELQAGYQPGHLPEYGRPSFPGCQSADRGLHRHYHAYLHLLLTVRRLLALVAVIAAFPRVAAAQGVLVAPHAIYLDHRTRSGSLTLYNPGADPVEITEIG